MHPDFRPRLRPYVQRVRDPRDPRVGYLVDELRQCAEPLRLTLEEFQALQWFDGMRSLREIRAAAERRPGCWPLPLDRLVAVARRLDDALLLDGPRWQRHIARPDRDPACIGCYDGNPQVLSRQIEELFTRPGGPGLPERRQLNGGLCAALIPHIDYARGGGTYAWGFKEVFEHTDASLFIIIGTSHYSAQRFTLTRRNFKTPLGTLSTDQDFIDRLVKHYGDGLFDDELQAHLPEHSIELEVVVLQWLFAGHRPIRIVPLVVGSFHDAILLDKHPAALEDVARMVQALRSAEAETPEPVCYLISGDLAHIGPKFNRRQPPLSGPELDRSRKQDQTLLQHLEQADSAGFYQVVAEENDARAICGFPPTVTLLEAVRPRRGRVLDYDRYIHPKGLESVSFASIGFYGRKNGDH
jgi:AmmeMemoRadiSam system protein B